MLNIREDLFSPQRKSVLGAVSVDALIVLCRWMERKFGLSWVTCALEGEYC